MDKGEVNRETYLRDQARLQKIYEKYGGQEGESHIR